MSNDEYWSSHPFVSYDGPDQNRVRASVKVIKGYGLITVLNESDSGKALQVKIKTRHIKHTSNGWIAKDDPAAKIVEKAYEDQQPIYYRVEVQRKKGIDRSLDIMELSESMEKAKENIERALAAVSLDGEDWVFAKGALTNPAEDPSGERNSATNYSLEELRSLNPNFNNTQNNSSSNVPSGNSSDTPWFVRFYDGKINPGAAAVDASIDTYSSTLRYFKDKEVTDKHLMLASNAILKIANIVQVKIYEDYDRVDSPDMGAASHRVARKIIFALMERTLPLNEEILSSQDNLKNWASEMETKAVAMWNWGLKNVDRYMPVPEESAANEE